MTQQHSPDLTIHFDLPLDTALPTTYQQISEDDYARNPTTVLDAVLDRAARIVATDVLHRIGKYGYDSGISKLWHSLVEPRVDALLAERVDAALQAELRPERKLGEPDATPIPLEAWIAKKIDAYLKETDSRNSHGPRPSRLDKAIEQCVGGDTQRALDATVKDARERALAAFSEVAEQKLSEALRQSIAAVAR